MSRLKTIEIKSPLGLKNSTVHLDYCGPEFKVSDPQSYSRRPWVMILWGIRDNAKNEKIDTVSYYIENYEPKDFFHIVESTANLIGKMLFNQRAKVISDVCENHVKKEFSKILGNAKEAGTKMKIRISKSQWEEMGRKAGWTK